MIFSRAMRPTNAIAPPTSWAVHALQGGFYHDGRFTTLTDVVNHYDTLWSLGLSDVEIEDLVAFLNTL